MPAFNRRTQARARYRTRARTQAGKHASAYPGAGAGARVGVHGGKREVVGRTCLGADLNQSDCGVIADSHSYTLRISPAVASDFIALALLDMIATLPGT